MAWSTPKTWVTSETVTAAQLNAHVRDNLLETSAATATTAGDIVYADGNKSMGSRLGIGAASGLLVSTGSAPVWRVPATDADTASGNSTSTSFASLGTGGAGFWAFASEIEVAVTTGTSALVLFKARLSNDTAGALTVMTYSVSGASTVAAIESAGIAYESSNANDLAQFSGMDLRTGLTAGSNTFTLTGRVTAGTGTIAFPEIVVIPF